MTEGNNRVSEGSSNEDTMLIVEQKPGVSFQTNTKDSIQLTFPRKEMGKKRM